jgi:hypothetical protein
MAERSVPNVVSQTNGFRQILIQTKTTGHGTRCRRNKTHVVHPRANMIILRKIEDLGLVPQASKRLGIDDPVNVSLEIRPEVI